MANLLSGPLSVLSRTTSGTKIRYQRYERKQGNRTDLGVQEPAHAGGYRQEKVYKKEQTG